MLGVGWWWWGLGCFLGDCCGIRFRAFGAWLLVCCLYWLLALRRWFLGCWADLIWLLLSWCGWGGMAVMVAWVCWFPVGLV